IFREVSGTAFSFAMLIALPGNTIINYSIGILTEKFGMNVFPYVVLVEIVMMIFIFLLIGKADKKTAIRY
ncbi:MAG TPA: hypothetical protein DDW66_05445, partial [Porphyromonadaceae bacterium]|nr:hypothetical protein [Porphyromonadaceae bacterium]